jgi:glycosyltransferase involved in cell wall biosynthesis
MAAAGHEPVLLAPRISPLFRKAAEQSLPAQPLKPSALVRLSASADLVHAHDARSHSLAALLRAPLAVARRVAFPIRRTPASRWKYARADHYIAVSQYVKRVLVGAGISSQKISVVYDGVPLPVAAASGRLIVAPSTADPAKGTHVLREAATLAGVSLHFSENLEEDLTQARLFVYITHQEGLGSAALLAMATGVPVVASRVGGLPEIIEDGQTGLLAENTPEAIASAMRRLLGDGTLRATLATRARETVRERFSVSAMVRDTLNVYERTLSC